MTAPVARVFHGHALLAKGCGQMMLRHRRQAMIMIKQNLDVGQAGGLGDGTHLERIVGAREHFVVAGLRFPAGAERGQIEAEAVVEFGEGAV